jgi:hypothetical protein
MARSKGISHDDAQNLMAEATKVQRFPGDLRLTRVNDVEPEPVDFLWSGRLARSHMTLISGAPGEGKTLDDLDPEGVLVLEIMKQARIQLNSDGPTKFSGYVLIDPAVIRSVATIQHRWRPSTPPVNKSRGFAGDESHPITPHSSQIWLADLTIQVSRRLALQQSCQPLLHR